MRRICPKKHKMTEMCRKQVKPSQMNKDVFKPDSIMYDNVVYMYMWLHMLPKLWPLLFNTPVHGLII